MNAFKLCFQFQHAPIQQGMSPETYILPSKPGKQPGVTKEQHKKGVANAVPVQVAMAAWRAVGYSLEGEEPPAGACHRAERLGHPRLAAKEVRGSGDSRVLCDAAYCNERATILHSGLWRCGRHNHIFMTHATEQVPGRGGLEETLCMVCRTGSWWCEDQRRERHQEAMSDMEEERLKMEGKHVKCFACKNVMCIACMMYRYVNAVDLGTDRAKWRCPHCLPRN